MTSDSLSIVVAISSVFSSMVFAYLAYSLSKQAQRVNTQQAISGLYHEVLKFRTEHPEVFRLCYLWRHDCFDAIYRQGSDEDKLWTNYYIHMELCLRFANVVLYGVKTQALDKKIYYAQFKPLLRLIFTENYPFLASIYKGAYLSSFVRDFIQESEKEGWHWEEAHLKLISHHVKLSKDEPSQTNTNKAS